MHQQPDSKTSAATESLKELYALFGRAVFLVIPHGKKVIETPKWDQISFEATQTPAYQRTLVNARARGGNLAVRLGPPSDGLRAIDVDSKQRVEEFLELNPRLRETVRVFGRRGAQFFFRLAAGAPFPGSNANENGAKDAVYVLKSENGEQFGEWRFGERKGAYSMIFGVHPDDVNIFWRIEGEQVLNDLIFDEMIKLPADVVLPWREHRSELSESIKNDEPSSAPYELKHIAPDLEKRIEAYLEACPVSIAGKGGDNVLFATACKIDNGFDLSEEQTYEMLAKWFNPLCQPPWNDDRLRYKAKQAHQAKSEKPRGHFLKEGYSVEEERPEEWPDPQSLHSEMRSVKQFDPEMLPEILRAWVADVAERMQCPIDFVAVGAICALSGVIGAGCSVRPKKHDNWSVVPNLWGGVIAAPGKKKTPALQEAMLPLKRLEVEAAEAYERAQGAHEADKIAFEAQKKKLKEKIENACDDDAKLDELKRQFAQLQPPAPPTARRYMTTDATIESVGVIIRDNPRGLTIYRDELIGLLVSWDRDDHKQDRAFHIQGWSGDGSYTYDRISRGRIFVPHLCETILGGIQPSKFHVYLALTKNDIENDGLLQRFQTLVYPDTPNGELEVVDRPPDKEARELVFSIFATLAKMDFVACGAQTEEHAKIPFFHFSEQAQQFFYDWSRSIEMKRRAESESIIVEHLSKFDSLMPSLALIFHLVERANWEFQRSVSQLLPEPAQQISLENAKLASAWCEYLESHARRIYGLALDLSGQAAQRILNKIEEGALHDNFNERDIYRRGWSFLDSKELVHAAIAELLETGWLRENKVAKTQQLGRPLSPTYRIHPRAEEILRRKE